MANVYLLYTMFTLPLRTTIVINKMGMIISAEFFSEYEFTHFRVWRVGRTQRRVEREQDHVRISSRHRSQNEFAKVRFSSLARRKRCRNSKGDVRHSLVRHREVLPRSSRHHKCQVKSLVRADANNLALLQLGSFDS